MRHREDVHQNLHANLLALWLEDCEIGIDNLIVIIRPCQALFCQFTKAELVMVDRTNSPGIIVAHSISMSAMWPQSRMWLAAQSG